MTNFVRDFTGTTGLDGPVTDLFPVPGGADLLQYADADKWNQLRDAMFDVRAWIKTGLTTGTYTNTTLIVDADGRITGVATGSGSGVPTSRQVIAGTGLSGGGDLSADRTLSLAATAVTPGAYTYSSITVNAQGQLTTAVSGATPAPASRTLTATAPVRIDGAGSADLSANRTLTVVDFSTTLKGVVTASADATAVLRGDNTWSTLAQLMTALAAAGLIRFHDLGDGSDGTPDLDGVNTFTWASLVGSTYTLTRSVFWAGATIRSGITIKSDGYIIRSNANISHSGDVNTNGITATSGTGAAVVWPTGTRELPGGLVGANSGNGGASTTTAAHFASTAAVAGGLAGAAASTGGNGNVGGTCHGSSGGGSGGIAVSPGAAGGIGGGVSLFAIASSAAGNMLEYRCATTGRTSAGGLWGLTSGGGAGANGSSGGNGGGAGSGAGMMVVIALSISGSGTWRAIGGGGSNGTTGATNGAGGGAGGTGGVITISVRTGAYPTTVDVSGGAGGNGGAGAGGGGAGGSGGQGGPGYYIKI